MKFSDVSEFDGPWRIRLVTFDRFPEIFSDSDCPAADRLASKCAVFASHYLQTPERQNLNIGWCADLMQVAIQHRLRCRAFVLAAHHTNVSTCFDWCDSLSVADVNEEPTGDNIARYLRKIRDADLSWVHIGQSGCIDRDRALFNTVLDLVDREFCDDDELVVVTALSGTPPKQLSPFTSLLPDYEINVAMWIRCPGRVGCSLQVLTGTADLVATLKFLTDPQAEMNDEPDRKRSVAEGRVNLIHAVQTPGQPRRRTLQIETDSARAVRTDEFLLVKQKNSGDFDVHSGGETALYVRPDDVWNIHDVAGEYHKVVSELSTLLNADPGRE